jgi:hypothetical protein
MQAQEKMMVALLYSQHVVGFEQAFYEAQAKLGSCSRVCAAALEHRLGPKLLLSGCCKPHGATSQKMLLGKGAFCEVDVALEGSDRMVALINLRIPNKAHEPTMAFQDLIIPELQESYPTTCTSCAGRLTGG